MKTALKTIRLINLTISILCLLLTIQLCLPFSVLYAQDGDNTVTFGAVGLQLGRMKQNSGLFPVNGYLFNLPADEILVQTSNLKDNKEKFAGIIGIGFFGTLPAGVSYQFQYGTLESSAVNSIMRFFIQDADALKHNLDVDYAYMGSFQWMTPIEGIRLGGTLYNLRMGYNHLNSSDNIRLSSEMERLDLYRLNSIRTSLESTRELTGNLKLTAEFFQNKSELLHSGTAQKAVTGEGYLGGVTYQVTDWFELGSYYSIYYTDRSDKEGKEWVSQGKQAARAWIKDFAVTSRIDINEKWILKIEGHLMNGLAGVENMSEEEWVKVAAEMTISF